MECHDEPFSYYTQTSLSGPTINLGAGYPGEDLLALSLFSRSSSSFLLGPHSRSTGLFSYGRPEGFLRFRLLVRDAVMAASSRAVHEDLLFVTNGSSNGLELLCRALLVPGGSVVFCEQLTYHLALNTLRRFGVQVVAVRADPRGGAGIDPNHLAELLAAPEHAKKRRALYCVPFGGNPTGATWSSETCELVSRLSLAHSLPVIADSVYEFLLFNDADCHERPGRLNGPHIHRLCSLSKLFAPGLRLGWIEAGNREVIELLKQDTVVDSGGGLNPVMAGLCEGMLESGAFLGHLALVRSELKKRCDVLCGEIETRLPMAGFERPTGGYFVLLTFPAGHEWVTSAAFWEEARGTFNVNAAPGTSFVSQVDEDGVGKRSLRLCFAFYGEEQLREGARRLQRAIESERGKRG